MKPHFARAVARLHHDPEPTGDGFRLIATRPDGTTTNSRVADEAGAVLLARTAYPGCAVRVACVATGRVVHEQSIEKGAEP